MSVRGFKSNITYTIKWKYCVKFTINIIQLTTKRTTKNTGYFSGILFCGFHGSAGGHKIKVHENSKPYTNPNIWTLNEINRKLPWRNTIEH